VVVADRFLASPLVQLGVAADRNRAELDAHELESLAAFATGRLRPDVSVLLDRAPEAPAVADGHTGPLPVEEHLRVRRLLTRMAAAEPHRYVVVDADGTVADVADRVLAGLTTVLPAPPRPSDARATDRLVRPSGDGSGTTTVVAEPGGRAEP
jgi:dTMP kinase